MLSNKDNFGSDISREIDEHHYRIQQEIDAAHSRNTSLLNSYGTSRPSPFSSAAMQQSDMTRDGHRDVPVAQVVAQENHQDTDCHICIPCVLHLYVSKRRMGFDAVCGIIKLDCPAPKCCA